MEIVKVSKKYQIVIPEKLRKQAGIKPGDKMAAITKHGLIQYIPIYSMKDTKGFILGLDTEKLRDASDRIDQH
jgi:AbrB family looped-hinge helix DNA binding protein